MNPREPASLLTDLYQLTMLQGYHDSGMEDVAVFEFFVRKLRPGRGFLMAAGLEQALEFLEGLQLLAGRNGMAGVHRTLQQQLSRQLETLRFSGDVHAMPEGTVFFPNEPILRVTAPIAQAQLVETRLINLLHFQTLIASKAARMVLMAPDKLLVDFGLRRAHGAEAGLLAARASYIAGFTGTATVLAGMQFGIPLFGTMAHSFVQAHDDETLAFEHFAHAQPDNVVLLIDTYDTEAAARKVVALAPQAGAAAASASRACASIPATSPSTRARCGRSSMRAGSSMSRSSPAAIWTNTSCATCWPPARRWTASASARAWTHRATCPIWTAPTSLQEYAGKARRKRSEGKQTWPGRKQVYRSYDADGRMAWDVVTLEADAQPGEPLLHAGDARRAAPGAGRKRWRIFAAMRQPT